MKYLNVFKIFTIHTICKKFNITNYTINRDGSIDVNSYVNLDTEDDRVGLPLKKREKLILKKIPLKFNYVSGDFYCSKHKLTSLEGAPKEVGGSFNCYDNQLISLVGATKEVGRDFNCVVNSLTSLEGAPEIVGGNFYCTNNSLTSLKGSLKRVGGDFFCGNNQLTTLEGAPKWVGGNFNCEYNPLPQLIYDNYKYIKEIVKWQDEYNIWRGEKLDEFRFKEMMIDIKEELNNDLLKTI